MTALQRYQVLRLDIANWEHWGGWRRRNWFDHIVVDVGRRDPYVRLKIGGLLRCVGGQLSGKGDAVSMSPVSVHLDHQFQTVGDHFYNLACSHGRAELPD